MHVHVMAVPENWLKVVDLEFYYPRELQSGVPVNKTENGKLDAVQMLYRDANENLYPTYPSSNTDEYNVAVGNYHRMSIFTDTIKILVPNSFQHTFSLQAGGMLRLRNFE